MSSNRNFRWNWEIRLFLQSFGYFKEDLFNVTPLKISKKYSFNPSLNWDDYSYLFFQKQRTMQSIIFSFFLKAQSHLNDLAASEAVAIEVVEAPGEKAAILGFVINFNLQKISKRSRDVQFWNTVYVTNKVWDKKVSKFGFIKTLKFLSKVSGKNM